MYTRTRCYWWMINKEMCPRLVGSCRNLWFSYKNTQSLTAFSFISSQGWKRTTLCMPLKFYVWTFGLNKLCLLINLKHGRYWEILLLVFSKCYFCLVDCLIDKLVGWSCIFSQWPRPGGPLRINQVKENVVLISAQALAIIYGDRSIDIFCIFCLWNETKNWALKWTN